MSESEFILKTMPPRVPRTALLRDRLSKIWSDIRERTAIHVYAPRGFGKTTLLSQWRRLWLEDGAIVAWLSVDSQDDPMRFTMALLHAIRSASGRPAFDDLASRYALQSEQQIEALTGLLSEIASLGSETVLIIDDAERLPELTLQRSLAYLIYNAPPNLHIVLGSRISLALPTAELLAKGNLAILSVDDLRLRLEESIAILEKQFGQKISLDDCTRLHDATEGWPIGLQLAAATIERSPDLPTAIRSLSGRHGDIESYFIESLFSQLPTPVAEFLTQIAILERMNVELCLSITKCEMTAAYLDQLMVDTPILMVAEQQDWMRLHPLARDFLLSRFEQLPLEQQEILHCRAFYWFAKQERFHEAACHALAAGDEPAAQSHAARAIWTLGTQGKLLEARMWLDRIPATLLADDIELRLIGAWIMAFGDRNREALAIAREALEDPLASPRTLVIATRVAAGAAAYADRLGLIPSFFIRWPELPAPMAEPVYALAYENPLALVALHAGNTDETRRRVSKAPPEGNTDTLPLALAFGRTMAGLSYLWDGDAYQAEAVLQPALMEAERSNGRRSMVSSLYAAVLAAALFERDQPAAAEAMLAHRLDVIERVGLPDTVHLAYRTLAYVALSQGDERRALNILDNLYVLSNNRNLPRLTMYALAEQIRIHSLRGCNETVDKLVDKLARLASIFNENDYLPFFMQYQLVFSIAKTYASLGRNDLETAALHLTKADILASQTRRGRDVLTVKVLRAVVARKQNAAHALPLLAEALSLAAIGGNSRLLIDTHPMAVLMAFEMEQTSTPSRLARGNNAEAKLDVSTYRSPTVTSGLLTPKEFQILRLLSGGMSNKLIARAIEISDETVKWHLKNLFSKLSAGTRKHAVDRARLLGLL
ncbi:MAG: LuxR C-terminal-related transcriptional regulator [Arenimonas sp.]